MGLLEPVDPNPLSLEVVQEVGHWNVSNVRRNGLDDAEARELADSRRQDEVTALVLRGLSKALGGGRN